MKTRMNLISATIFLGFLNSGVVFSNDSIFDDSDVNAASDAPSSNVKKIAACCGGGTMYDLNKPAHKIAYERAISSGIQNMACGCALNPFAQWLWYGEAAKPQPSLFQKSINRSNL